MISNKTIQKFDELNIGSQYLDGLTISELSQLSHSGTKQILEYLRLKNIPRREAKKRFRNENIPVVGSKFGLWTVISDEIKRGSIDKNINDRNIYWKVQCKCGNIAWRKHTLLKNGMSTRCKKCGNRKFFDKNGDYVCNSYFNSLVNKAKLSLKTRKSVSRYPFTITAKDVFELYIKQNKKCALSGVDISIDNNKNFKEQKISIDRIDSNKGYEKDNIQLVDKKVNLMKGKLDNLEFIKLCKLISDNNIK